MLLRCCMAGSIFVPLEVKFVANASIIEQKQQVVNQLAEQMKNASSGVLVDYKGITVEDDTKLRANLRKSGVSYAVVKNTLCARACEAIGFGELRGVLEGTTALALGDDQVAPAKILNDFAKEVKSLAAIPPKEILIGRILGSLQSSLYGFAYAIQAIIDKNGEATAEEPAPAAE